MAGALGEEPAAGHVALRRAAAVEPQQRADQHRVGWIGAGFVCVVRVAHQARGDAGDGATAAGEVVAVVAGVAGAAGTAHIRHQVAVALVPAGGREVVARAGAKQRHERVDQRGFAAAGGADDGGVGRVNTGLVTARKRAPVVEVQLVQVVAGGRLAGRRFGCGFCWGFVGGRRRRHQLELGRGFGHSVSCVSPVEVGLAEVPLDVPPEVPPAASARRCCSSACRFCGLAR